MVKPILKGEQIFHKAEPAAIDDMPIGTDLLDTLRANAEACAGMAANMIGANKRVIVFMSDGKPVLMFNPEYVYQREPYQAEEGCLSLSGTRKTTRYKSIKLRYRNEDFAERIKTFKGYVAQIIQHEMDHCGGVVI